MRCPGCPGLPRLGGRFGTSPGISLCVTSRGLGQRAAGVTVFGGAWLRFRRYRLRRSAGVAEGSPAASSAACGAGGLGVVRATNECSFALGRVAPGTVLTRLVVRFQRCRRMVLASACTVLWCVQEPPHPPDARSGGCGGCRVIVEVACPRYCRPDRWPSNSREGFCYSRESPRSFSGASSGLAPGRSQVGHRCDLLLCGWWSESRWVGLAPDTSTTPLR